MTTNCTQNAWFDIAKIVGDEIKSEIEKNFAGTKIYISKRTTSVKAHGTRLAEILGDMSTKISDEFGGTKIYVPNPEILRKRAILSARNVEIMQMKKSGYKISTISLAHKISSRAVENIIKNEAAK